MEILDHLGSELRRRRVALNLTQSEVARIAGVSNRWVSALETSADRPPVITTADLLMRAVGARVVVVAADEVPPTPAEREVLAAWTQLDQEGTEVLLSLIRRWNGLDPTSRAIMKVCATNIAQR